MRKHVLMWLFGTDDIEEYIEILVSARRYVKEHLQTLHELIKEIEDHKKSLNLIRKLLKICENHGINADEEIKYITLED